MFNWKNFFFFLVLDFIAVTVFFGRVFFFFLVVIRTIIDKGTYSMPDIARKKIFFIQDENADVKRNGIICPGFKISSRVGIWTQVWLNIKLAFLTIYWDIRLLLYHCLFKQNSSTWAYYSYRSLQMMLWIWTKVWIWVSRFPFQPRQVSAGQTCEVQWYIKEAQYVFVDWLYWCRTG